MQQTTSAVVQRPGCATVARRPAAAAAARAAALPPAHRRPAPTRARPARLLHVAAAEGGAAAAVAEAEPMQLPTRLNTIPHDREVRQWFYRDLTAGVMAALAAGQTRVLARSTFPELNTEFDVYRIGTLLELVRHLATELTAADPSRTVRVCVQQPLGEGVFAGTPLSLNGVMRIMGQMDWGEAKSRIVLGNIGAEQVEGADCFILIAPQNIVGHSIVPFLSEMVEAAEAAGKPVILINPKLGDIQSAGGVMSIRGRQERLDFAATFTCAYHFRLLYKGVTMFPIMGALRHSFGGQWEVYRRCELGAGREEYRRIGSFPEEPKPPQITEAFKAAWAAAAAAAAAGQ